MSRSVERASMLVAALMVTVSLGVSAAGYKGLGRPATEAEIKAWDIDVRPDFKGLPPGSGSVVDGEKIWTQKCSSCHGDFGDANHVFPPLVGGTTADDIKTGRVASLRQTGQVRTTIAKVATLSTLWDFINRAMPWDKPKSLETNEVYAVLAYMLNLAEVVPADFVLSEKNMVQVQARMPNRNGTTRDHGMWDIRGKPDTKNTACMRNCGGKVEVSSSLPEFARAAHGELQQQNREYGAIRGARTTPPDSASALPASAAPKAPTGLLASNGCSGCHMLDAKLVGPSFRQIAQRHGKRPDLGSYLKGRILNGGVGTWGEIPMPPQPQLAKADLETMVTWLSQGAPD